MMFHIKNVYKKRYLGLVHKDGSEKIIHLENVKKSVRRISQNSSVPLSKFPVKTNARHRTSYSLPR